MVGGGILDIRAWPCGRMTIDPRIPTMRGRSVSGFHRPVWGEGVPLGAQLFPSMELTAEELLGTFELLLLLLLLGPMSP